MEVGELLGGGCSVAVIVGDVECFLGWEVGRLFVVVVVRIC